MRTASESANANWGVFVEPHRMKVIVIAGASSNVGKTTLAKNLERVLPGTSVVKIGHGGRKPEIRNHFHDLGTSLSKICEDHAGAAWLLIESNAILREVQPDLVIYLEGKNPKPSAEHARSRADIISGRIVHGDVPILATRLGIPVDLMTTLVRLTGDGFHVPERESPE